MGALEGRVAVITGAGRGLGREHALLFASEGAKVVVNDFGGTAAGEDTDTSVAQQVVNEITALGGQAVANTDSVASWTGAKRLIDTALEAFGELHVLVNNAGILRDRMLVNMSEQDWDAVFDVHVKGTFCTTRHAASYWRESKKAGKELRPTVVCTSSPAGLFNNIGQANYGAAKAAIVTFATIAAKELQQYDVRVNTIAPVARTRLTLQTPGLAERIGSPQEPDAFDVWDPRNVSPLVGLLSTADCPFSGNTFFVAGGKVAALQGWRTLHTLNAEGRWSIAELERHAKALLDAAPEKQGFLLSEADSSDLFVGLEGDS